MTIEEPQTVPVSTIEEPQTVSVSTTEKKKRKVKLFKNRRVRRCTHKYMRRYDADLWGKIALNGKINKTPSEYTIMLAKI
jgi:hypothetical protein